MSSRIPPRSRKAVPVPMVEIKVRRHAKEKRQTRETLPRDDGADHSRSLKDLASELVEIVEQHSSQVTMNTSEEPLQGANPLLPCEESMPSKTASAPSASLFLFMLPRLKSDDVHPTRRQSTDTHLRRLSQRSMSSSGTDHST